ncbi:MAG: L-lactate permease [Candidatus Eisenbacteria bacterium]|nr:L-lactate permease [Candidatus Eisenbacteria bacterium]
MRRALPRFLRHGDGALPPRRQSAPPAPRELTVESRKFKVWGDFVAQTERRAGLARRDGRRRGRPGWLRPGRGSHRERDPMRGEEWMQRLRGERRSRGADLPLRNGSLALVLCLLIGLLAVGMLADVAAADNGGAAASASETVSGPNFLKFILALLPLLVVLAGIVFLQQSGATMAIVGWIVSVILAVAYFKTDLMVALGGSWYGFVKSFGISIAVVFTMFMIFLMKEVGALTIISGAVKRTVVGKEVQALNIGIGFGSFLTSLGIVTPAMFPPLLMAMGFGPAAAVAISVLGYNATCSFALLSIPITLPAEIFGLDLLAFTFKVCIFLPLVSVGLAFGILWLVGGRESMKRGAVPAIVAGFSIAAFALLFAVINYAAGQEIIPVRIIGILAGLLSMGVLISWQRIFQGRQIAGELAQVKRENPVDAPALWRALSPWIILTALAAVVSFPKINAWLSGIPGGFEIFHVFDRPVDLNILGQIYTWILIAVLLSTIFLRPTAQQWRTAIDVWRKRFLSPFLAYAVYFSIAYVMAWSAMETITGASGTTLMRTAFFEGWNMNIVVGASLATFFGGAYSYVSPTLGLFGAVVGGSETGSNVLFMKIQQQASNQLGLSEKQFMTIYGAHAATGGVASAITPAKITNAVATIGEGKKLEARIMRKHMAIAVLLTVVIGIMTGIFVSMAF